jgi:hypothetical protein
MINRDDFLCSSCSSVVSFLPLIVADVRRWIFVVCMSARGRAQSHLGMRPTQHNNNLCTKIREIRKIRGCILPWRHLAADCA